MDIYKQLNQLSNKKYNKKWNELPVKQRDNIFDIVKEFNKKVK